MTPFATIHIVGTVESVKTEQVGSKGFTKATVVVDLGDEEKAHFEAVHGLRHVAETLAVGTKISVHAHLRSRQWQDKRFHDVRAVSISIVCDEPEREPRGQGAPPRRQEAQQQPKAQDAQPEPAEGTQAAQPQEDDVPF